MFRTGCLPNAALIHCLAKARSIPPALWLKMRMSVIEATQELANDKEVITNIPFMVSRELDV
jgi:hypothetical protein